MRKWSGNACELTNFVFQIENKNVILICTIYYEYQKFHAEEEFYCGRTYTNDAAVYENKRGIS